MAQLAQEKYGELVLAKLREELVLKDGVVFNNDYDGDPTAGAVKVPTRDDEVAAGDYDRAAGLARRRRGERPLLGPGVARAAPPRRVPRPPRGPARPRARPEEHGPGHRPRGPRRRRQSVHRRLQARLQR